MKIEPFRSSRMGSGQKGTAAAAVAARTIAQRARIVVTQAGDDAEVIPERFQRREDR